MMMASNHEGAFALRATEDDEDDVHPVLTGVQAHGRVEGALFTFTLHQTYRNTSARTLEVVYTFPLPARAVLLDMAAQFGARRLVCRVLPRAQAEDLYEDALAEGDAPVLLERAGDGLHTANLGNLRRGETVTLELRIAQPLTFEQGRLRLALPMTIAPRYGSPARAGLQPQQEPRHSLRADYPLALKVEVAGTLAEGHVECPSHPAQFTRTETGLCMTLAPLARMDRDVVLWLWATPQGPGPNRKEHREPPEPPGLLTLADDPVTGGRTALAAFALPRTRADRAVALKLLVDGSGSMAGDAIASAREALDGLAQALQTGDRISLTRFGSHAEVVLYPTDCTDEAVDTLRHEIHRIRATLGGTEMAKALALTFSLRRGPAARLGVGRGTGGSDVLLVTDGEVWDVDATVEAARRSAHRVFVIGVGASPAEAVLRRLAAATGGACEFATPGEALQATALRMLERMRQAPPPALRLDWGLPAGAVPSWTLPPPAGAFGGDTVLAIAGFAPSARPTAARLMTADGTVLAQATLAGPAATGDELPRIAAARRLEGWLDGLDTGETDEHLIAAVARREGRQTEAADEALDEASVRRRVAAMPSEAPGPETLGEETRRARALDLALAYRLVSPLTHAVLVHRRDEADKPEDEATLHQVASMVAAGWGGTGSVRAMASGGVAHAVRSVHPMRLARHALRAQDTTPSLYRSCRSAVDAAAATSHATSAATAPATSHALRLAASPEMAPLPSDRPHTLAEISLAVADHLDTGGSVASLVPLTRTFRHQARLADAMAAVIALLARSAPFLRTDPGDPTDPDIEEGLAWLCLAHWVAERHAATGAVPAAAPLRDRLEATGAPAALSDPIHTLLDAHLGRVSPTSWRAARVQRLRRQLHPA